MNKPCSADSYNGQPNRVSKKPPPELRVCRIKLPPDQNIFDRLHVLASIGKIVVASNLTASLICNPVDCSVRLR